LIDAHPIRYAASQELPKDSTYASRTTQESSAASKLATRSIRRLRSWSTIVQSVKGRRRTTLAERLKAATAL